MRASGSSNTVSASSKATPCFLRFSRAVCKKLEADGIKLAVGYRKVPALNIAIAFIADPWDTSIELTERLDNVR
jgi:hypothetical protein